MLVWLGVGPSPLVKLTSIRYSDQFTVERRDLNETRGWLATAVVPPFQLFGYPQGALRCQFLLFVVCNIIEYTITISAFKNGVL